MATRKLSNQGTASSLLAEDRIQGSGEFSLEFLHPELLPIVQAVQTGESSQRRRTEARRNSGVGREKFDQESEFVSSKRNCIRNSDSFRLQGQYPAQ